MNDFGSGWRGGIAQALAALPVALVPQERDERGRDGIARTPGPSTSLTT
jgi:hypothetical protein